MFPYFILFGRMITTYAILAIAGMLFCGTIFCIQIRRRNMDDNDAILFLLAVAVGMYIGSHLLYAFTNLHEIPQLFHSKNFKEFILILGTIFGGAVFYGGLFGGIAGGVLAIRKMKLDRNVYMDLLAVIAPLFHAIARIGCFLGGCCYGIESEFGLVVHGNTLVPELNDVSRFPVQLLEAACNFLLFFFLWKMYHSNHKEKYKGKLIYMYLSIYAAIRFFDEFLRGDVIRGFVGIFSTSQWISLLVEAVLGIMAVRTYWGKKSGIKKMKTHTMKSILFFLFFLTITLTSGCKKESIQPQKQQNTQQKSLEYHLSERTCPYQIQQLTAVHIDEEFFTPHLIDNYLTETATYSLYRRTYYTDTEDPMSQVNEHHIFVQPFDGSEGYFLPPISLQRLYLDEIQSIQNDEIWFKLLVTQLVEKSKNHYALVDHMVLAKFSENGTEEEQIDVTELLKQSETKDLADIYQIVMDSEHWVYVTDYDNRLMVFDDTGKKVIEKVFDDARHMHKMFLSKSEKELLCFYDDSESINKKMYCVRVNKETLDISEPVELPKQVGSYAISFLPADGYDFCYDDQKHIIGYTMATGEAVQLLDWSESGMESPIFFDMIQLSGGRFAFMKDTFQPEVYLCTELTKEQIAERKTLRLATVYADEEVKKAIYLFNQSHAEFQIELTDYSVYSKDGDYLAPLYRLNEDIALGKIPDIIQTTPILPMRSYIQKGMFVDLYPYIDRDTAINREDYIPNILSLMESGGKLYELLPSFYVKTMVGRASAWQEKEQGWTTEEFLNYEQEAAPEKINFRFTAPNAVLNYLSVGIQDTLIDYESGACDFMGEEYLAILRGAKHLVNKFAQVDKEWMTPADTDFMTAEIADYYDYLYLKKQLFGEDIYLMGYPCADRNGTTIAMCNWGLAISSQSQYKDYAWEFVRYFMTDDYQNKILYGFPIKKTALTETEHRAMEDPTYWYGRYTMYSELIDKEKLILTEEDIEEFRKQIFSITHISIIDDTISDIINEETAMYFEGIKNEEEVARLIQNRVQIYLQEMQ